MQFTTSPPPASYLDFVQITQDVIRDLTNFEIKDKDSLNIPHIEYFKKLGGVLAKIPKDDLEHYLTFRELIHLASGTTSRMRDLYNAWNMVKGGSSIPKPRQVLLQKSISNILNIFLLTSEILYFSIQIRI